LFFTHSEQKEILIAEEIRSVQPFLQDLISGEKWEWKLGALSRTGLIDRLVSDSEK